MYTMLKQLPLLILIATLSACAPIVPPQETDTQPQVIPEEQGDMYENNEIAEEELVVVERLLPSGFIEIGDRDAPVVLLMFTEHHCRYCKQFYHEHLKKLLSKYINEGKLRLQIGILPLKKYIDSERAAMGLLCAATQGKGIPMHELLFELGARDEAVLLSEANTLELDTNLFTQCLQSDDTRRTLERQKSIARTLDVTLVPTFFLNGEKSVGLPYYADLEVMIEEKL